MKPFTGWRDRAVFWLANRVLRLASRRCQRTLSELIGSGMAVADLHGKVDAAMEKGMVTSSDLQT